jgi:broad specificity phosphatase PhoE
MPGSNESKLPPKLPSGRPPLRILLVRHGQSTAQEPDAKAQVFGEACLTELGHRQATVAAQAARELMPKLTKIHSSHYRRAWETADFFAYAFDDDFEQGKPGAKQVRVEKIENAHEFTYLSHVRTQHLDAKQRLTEVKSYWEDANAVHIDGPDAESFKYFFTRTGDALAALALNMLDEEQEAAILVTHGWFMRAALFRILTLDDMWRDQYVDGPLMRRFYQFADTLRVPNTSFLPLFLHESGWSAGGLMTAHIPLNLRTL